MSEHAATASGALTIEGVISTTNKGLGFLKRPESKEDIRIEAGFLGTAMHGDTVQVRLRPAARGMPPSGEVVGIIKRARTRFVGAVEHENGVAFVVPDDRHIYKDFIIPSPPAELKVGDKVLVEVENWGEPSKNPLARVLEIIGTKGEHNTEMRSIILERGIDDAFPPEVKREAEEIHRTRGAITSEDIAQRRDFRATPTFTIDPVDAKDFDDAISIQKAGDGTWEIGIHIADVSHFVRPGMTLDAEALKRAFSTYLVDRTIPMLPEVLSNDLCSLKPDEDRLTFSAVFCLDAQGSVSARWFGKGLIHSQKRFTYEEAQGILDAGEGIFHAELDTLNAVAKNLREERTRAGSIDFEQHEVRFELSDDGVPLEVYLKDRLDTHKLVEEYMLLANREVARFVYENFGKSKRHTFVYRVHDTPDKEKIGELAEFVRALGYNLELSKNGGVTGTALNTLFAKVAGTPEEALIKTAGLRSMAKAAYSAVNIGHFGLALPWYTHFTSPIRRYADLLVHRLLQAALTTKKLPNEQWGQYERIAGQISQKEISVIDAERESIKLKQVEFMTPKIGAEFDAVISGVSEWGIFVQEKESKAEGLVRIGTLGDDFFVLEPKKYRLIGERTKKTFTLGDPVRVKLMAADPDRKTLDFALA